MCVCMFIVRGEGEKGSATECCIFLSLFNKSLIMAGASGLRDCVFSARGS